MIVFNRFLQIGNSKLAIDKSHPLSNKYATDYSDFETRLSKLCKKDDSIDIIMLPTRVLLAILPDGSRHANGYTHPL